MKHGSQTRSQFCGICRSWILYELCLQLVPQTHLRERHLEHTVVETWLCLVVFTSQPASATVSGPRAKKMTPRFHEGRTVGHNVHVHQLDLLLTVDFQANVGATLRAPMMPETIIPRVVAVCDAVNRSNVSSSSSASVCCATATSLGVAF